jgi:hypothetical protein
MREDRLQAAKVYDRCKIYDVALAGSFVGGWVAWTGMELRIAEKDAVRCYLVRLSFLIV